MPKPAPEFRVRLLIIIVIGILISAVGAPALACPDCALARQAREQLFAGLWPSVVPLLSIVVILAGLVLAALRRSRLEAAGLLLGMGLGGFVDGIVLHQLLQWHNMFSSRVPPIDLLSMKYNMIWDGVFHALAWLMTAAGLALLWVALRQPGLVASTGAWIGTLLLGWGLFNVVEGSISHLLAGIHHVRPGAHQRAWDVGFLILGMGQILGGWMLLRWAGAPRVGESRR